MTIGSESATESASQAPEVEDDEHGGGSRGPSLDRGDAGADGSDGREPLPPATLWLIDGYNVLNTRSFRDPKPGEADVPSEARRPDGSGADDVTAAGAPHGGERWWSAERRERLVSLARRFPDPDVEIWVVFDGSRAPETPQRSDRPAVWVAFAPSADDWILKRIRETDSPGGIAVVTRDRKVAARARSRGARVVWPLRFIRVCGGAAVPRRTESAAMPTKPHER